MGQQCDMAPRSPPRKAYGGERKVSFFAGGCPKKSWTCKYGVKKCRMALQNPRLKVHNHRLPHKFRTNPERGQCWTKRDERGGLLFWERHDFCGRFWADGGISPPHPKHTAGGTPTKGFPRPWEHHGTTGPFCLAGVFTCQCLHVVVRFQPSIVQTCLGSQKRQRGQR